jgi:hypothetical protein
MDLQTCVGFTYVWLFCLFFLVGLGFELRASHLQSRHTISWATPPVHFALIILEMGVSWTICPGWPRTEILPISTYQVTRITGVSHWWLACMWLLNCLAILPSGSQFSYLAYFKATLFCTVVVSSDAVEQISPHRFLAALCSLVHTVPLHGVQTVNPNPFGHIHCATQTKLFKLSDTFFSLVKWRLCEIKKYKVFS